MPRIASHSDFVCGTVGSATTDWAAPAWEFDFEELAWVAYTGDYDASAYNYMTFDTPQDIPESNGAWFRVATNADVTLPDWSALTKITCLSGYGPMRAVWNRSRGSGSTSGVYGNSVITLWTRTTNHTNYQMSFTEYSVWSGEQSISGLDDFEDGLGCGDFWQQTSQRGRSTFVMIR